MHNKYSKTGKFTLFISYVQSVSDKATDFLKKNAPNVPAYDQVRLEHAPCGRGIPHTVLFDHTGKVVGTGSADKLMPLIEDLIKGTPAPPSPILGEVEVKYFKSQAKQLADGKPVSYILKYLKSCTEKDDDKGKEAKALINAVNTYIDGKKKELMSQAETSPAKTLMNLKSFLLQIRTLKEWDELNNLYSELRKDRYVNSLASLMSRVKNIQDKIAKKGTAGKYETKALERYKDSMQKLIDSSQTPETVKKEATEFIGSF